MLAKWHKLVVLFWGWWVARTTMGSLGAGHYLCHGRLLQLWGGLCDSLATRQNKEVWINGGRSVFCFKKTLNMIYICGSHWHFFLWCSTHFLLQKALNNFINMTCSRRQNDCMLFCVHYWIDRDSMLKVSSPLAIQEYAGSKGHNQAIYHNFKI